MANPLRELLPEPWKSGAHYWDDEAAMRAYLDAVEDLARRAVSVACYLDRLLPSSMSNDTQDELHASAAHVCPGIEDRQ